MTFDTLSIAMIILATITDILFIWVLHYTSTRYPKPSNSRKWNEPGDNKHECCEKCCNEELSRCFCGIRCIKCEQSWQCCCNGPLELFTPRYPIELFVRHQSESYIEEQKDDEYVDEEDMTTEIKELKLKTEKYKKCCCHSCCSIIWRVWFLFCSILAFIVFCVFAFTMFFEFIIGCLTWNHGKFLGLIVAIFIICRIFVWFLIHSGRAVWLTFYNSCDVNNILIVEWWRCWQIFWCCVFSAIYIVSIDPNELSNAIFKESMARFMVIQGVTWITLYLISVIISTVCLTLRIFGIHNDCDRFLDFYRWDCIKNSKQCVTYSIDTAQYLLVFEKNKMVAEYDINWMDYLFGIRPGHTNNCYIYTRYICAALLVVVGLVLMITGYCLGDGYELMTFCGWTFLIYYVLIILLRTDHFDDIIFKQWNGISFKKISLLLKEIMVQHKTYFNTIHSDVVVLRNIDIWSLIYDSKRIQLNFDEQKKDVHMKNDNVENTIWSKKGCNYNLWLTIIVLIIAFVLVIWLRYELNNDIKSITEEYDDTNVANWNWSHTGYNQYPFCRTAYMNGYLNAYDLIWLSPSAKYVKDTNYLQMHFNAWFGANDTGWNYSSAIVHYVDQGDRKSIPTVYYVRNEKYKIDLVVVRGSYTAADWIQDVALWTEPAFVQLSSYVVPINNIFDDGFLRDFVYYASRFQGLIFPELRERYDEPVYDFIVENITKYNKNYNKENEGNLILLVGHSLGAGISEIVASRLHADGYGENVVGFGLSPPGTLWSSRKFGYDFLDLDVSAYTVQPRRDPVPMVDVQGGSVQYIDCDAYKPWSCHSSIRSLCEVYHSCGDDTVKITDRKKQFISCLCQDLNDWYNCTALIMNVSVDGMDKSSSFAHTMREMYDHYKDPFILKENEYLEWSFGDNVVLLYVSFALIGILFCFLGICIGNICKGNICKYNKNTFYSI